MAELAQRILKRIALAPLPDPEVVQRVMAETHLPEPVCRLLVQRGFTEKEAIRAFLQPKPEHLHNPFEMKDLRKIVDRLIEARKRGEKIFIHGDYDVDGLSSTTLLTRVLRELGFEVKPFVPHRMLDGYGVSMRGVKLAAEEGYRLMLTCDTGISAAEEVRQAVETYGFEVLVTDHHHVPDVLPPAHALVNPHQSDCPYPFKELCGVGVAFKVLQGLVMDLGLDAEQVLFPYLDLVALGTVCDVVPLVGENRALVKMGLRQMQNSRILGIRKILETAGISPAKVDEWTCGFALGPRLNAIGRIDNAGVGLELLLSRYEAHAQDFANTLEKANNDRKEMTAEMERAAIDAVESRGSLEDLWGIVIYLEEGHHGIVGIVASRIVERYNRPTFIFAPDHDTGKWKGSGRAPKTGQVNLYDALVQCGEYLEKFGGHVAAAGATLAVQDEPGRAAFAEAFNRAAQSQMTEEDLIPRVHADIPVGLGEVTLDTYNYLKRFAPFGESNPSIQMLAQGAQLVEVRKIGQEKNHLRFVLEQDGVRFVALAWRMADQIPDITEAKLPIPVDVVFRLKENVYNGNFELQLEVQEIRPAGPVGGAGKGGQSGMRFPALLASLPEV